MTVGVFVTRFSSTTIANPLADTRSLFQRQAAVVLAIPTTYYRLNAGPSPGLVVGITLGAIAGFLLLAWLLFFIIQLRQKNRRVIEEEIIERRASRSRSARRS